MKKSLLLLIYMLLLISNIVFSQPTDLEKKIQNRLDYFFKQHEILNSLLKNSKKIPRLTFNRYMEIKYQQDIYMYAVETKENPGMYILFDKDIDKIYQWYYDLQGNPLDIFKLRNKVDIPVFLFDKISKDREAYPFKLKAYNTPFANLVTGIPIEELKKDEFDEFYYNKPFLKAKNMIDTKKQIDFINSLKSDNDLAFSGNPQNPAYKCYFYTLSSYIDNIVFKMAPKNLNNYTDFLNGKKIKGTSPRFLELCYRELSKTNDRFKIMSEFFITDPVTKDGIAYSLKSAMEIPKMLYKLPERIYDPYIPNNYFKKSNFRYLNKLSELRTDYSVPEKIHHDFIKIKKSILSNRFLVGGIGLRYMGSELRTSAHAVMICGYARKGDKTFYIYQDTYGDKKDLLLIPSTYFREIYHYETDYKINKKTFKNTTTIYFRNIFNNLEPLEYIVGKGFDYTSANNKYIFDNYNSPVIVEMKPFFQGTAELEI